MASAPAVYVHNACKSYGKKEVLKNLCMRVPKGCIYGLLGSSGCGKTTLLSCIVGRRNLHSGDIWVLGGKPGTPGSGVPGPKIGYMPQDIALVGEFTVRDAIFYFGRIFDMPESLIEERFVEISTLLDLPPKDRYIKNCSGGQQRRISFAASMVHMPELLILDEPTVGVDPILRERIWNYLVEVTTKRSIAVIITTHYIEEARQANVIGLMRDGCLLAQESPSKLLAMFQAEVLEDVFFILSQRQNEGKLNEITNDPPIEGSNADISLASFDTTHGSTDILAPEQKKQKKLNLSGYSLNRKRFAALMDKNWKQFYRNISGMIFIFMFPIAQNVAFLLAVGPDIRSIPLGIVNHESNSILCPDFNFTNTAIPSDYDCHLSNLSCRFLTYLEDPMIHKVKYDSLSDAFEDASHGKVIGVMHMSANFTESLEERIHQGRNVDENVLAFSEIAVRMDMSNRQMGGTIKYKLLQLYRDFQKDLLLDCHYDPKYGDFVDVTTLYGKSDDPFTDYMTPGLLLTIMFFLMTLMAAQIIVADRSDGVWDRSIIAGVSSLEISLTHFILQLGIVTVYTIQVIVITFHIFKVKVVGSMWTIALLTFFQGVAGVGFGFWISIISVNVMMANVLTSGSFYIMILLCGLVWPIEGMPVVLQWISRCLPFTIATESLRNVMKKGWLLTHFNVWNGLGIEFLWIIGFGIINTILIQSKR